VLAGLKEKRLSLTATEKWMWAPFPNAARSDDLQLSHWKKANEEDNDYKVVRSGVELVDFSKEEYDKVEQDASWSYEETLQLWELCKEFDLRFIIIQDRYSPQWPERTVEDLKERYYTLSRLILELRGVTDHPILQLPYNAQYERKRKAQLEKYVLRTKEQDEEEKQLSEEARKLDARIKKEEKEQRIYEKLMQRDSDIELPDWPAAKHEAKAPTLRSTFLRQPQLQSRVQKKIETILADLQIPERPYPTPEIVQAYERLKKDILILQYLQKHTVKKENEKRALTEKIQELRTQRERRAQHLMERPKTSIPPTATTTKMAISAMNTMLPMRKTTSAPQTPEVKDEPMPTKRPRKS
jgi:DNA methyltransferase 1-associated protein 1